MTDNQQLPSPSGSREAQKEESLEPLTPFGEFIQEELNARGWTRADLASRMGDTPEECGICQLAVEMAMCVSDRNLIMGDDTSQALGRAFGVSPKLFVNLYNAMRPQ